MANVQLVENLRRLREEHNYTQLQVSSRLNISRQAYSNYETGKRVPDLDTLIRLADIYQVTLEQLLTQVCSKNSVAGESKGPYVPGMIIKTGDTVYLSDEEFSVLQHYRSASSDDRHLVRKVLNIVFPPDPDSKK